MLKEVECDSVLARATCSAWQLGKSAVSRVWRNWPFAAAAHFSLLKHFSPCHKRHPTCSTCYLHTWAPGLEIVRRVPT